MSNFMREVVSQPALWRRGAAVASSERALLPADGEKVAFIGCGTSLYVAEAVAAYREKQGFGASDAFPASEAPLAIRPYDVLVAVTRSGTTTEVLEAISNASASARVLAITANEGGPIGDAVRERITLPWADERSIVQTRFATTVLALLLSHCGWDVEASATRAQEVLEARLPSHIEEAKQFVFLGRGFAAGVAQEAALKMRETLGAWTEAYPTREYRHGPISAAGAHSVVWILDNEEPGIDQEIAATGAHVVRGSGDPLAELVLVHRVAGHLAELRGIDPDSPRHLTRSIVLQD